MQSVENHQAKELVGLLRKTIWHLKASQPSAWTAWEPKQVIEALEGEIFALDRSGRPSDAVGLHARFGATACIQEIAIENNWADEYMAIAAKVDQLIAACSSQ